MAKSLWDNFRDADTYDVSAPSAPIANPKSNAILDIFEPQENSDYEPLKVPDPVAQAAPSVEPSDPWGAFQDAQQEKQADAFSQFEDAASNNWYDFGPDLALDVASGAADVAGLVPSAISWLTSASANDDSFLGSVNRGFTKASDVISGVGEGFQESKSDFSRQQQKQPIISVEDSGQWSFDAPNWEQIKSVALRSLAPGGVIGKGGQVISRGVEGLTAASPTLAKILGYGVSNAVYNAPSTYSDVRREAYDYYIAKGVDAKEAEALSREAGDVAAKIMSGASLATGGISGVAARNNGNLLRDFARGTGIEALGEIPEEGIQSIAGDVGIGREVDYAKAAENAILAAPGAVQGGVMAAMERSSAEPPPSAPPSLPQVDLPPVNPESPMATQWAESPQSPLPETGGPLKITVTPEANQAPAAPATSNIVAEAMRRLQQQASGALPEEGQQPTAAPTPQSSAPAEYDPMRAIRDMARQQIQLNPQEDETESLFADPAETEREARRIIRYMNENGIGEDQERRAIESVEADQDKKAQEDIDAHIRRLAESMQLEGAGTASSPIRAETADAVSVADMRVNPAPSEAQKAAGNFKKGHVNIQGLNISIENPAGGERSGVDKDGAPWSVKMPVSYGYIKKTEGADGDHLDAFIGPNPSSEQVFVIDQKDLDTGEFDEHKSMLGFDSQQQAVDAYVNSFSDGKGGERIMNAPVPMTVAEYKEWLATPQNQKKPLSTAKNNEISSKIGESEVIQSEGQEKGRRRQEVLTSTAQAAGSTAPAANLPPSSSYIVRDKITGEAVTELTSKSAAEKVNTEKYDVVPALQHLQELNDKDSKAAKAMRGEAVSPAVSEDSTPSKNPWEMTKEEFDSDVIYQGVHPHSDDTKPSRWHSTSPKDAVKFATAPSDRPSKTKARIDVSRKSSLPKESHTIDKTEGMDGVHYYTGGLESHAQKIASIPVEQAENAHKYLVEQALKEGKSVPDSVLKQYPDLKKKYAKPPVDTLPSIEGLTPGTAETAMAEAEKLHDATKDEAERASLKEYMDKAAKVAAPAARQEAQESPYPEISKKIEGMRPEYARQRLASLNKKLQAGIALKPAEMYERERLSLKNPVEKPSATGEMSLDDFYEVKKKMRSGEISAEDIKKEFNRARESKQILASLEKMKREELVKKFLGISRGENKRQMVESAYRKILGQFHLGDSMSWSPFTESHGEAVARHVNAQTDDDVKKYAQRVKDSESRYKEAEKDYAKAVTNPETLEEYRQFVRANGMDKLTSEQLAEYDKLSTDESLRKKSEQKAKDSVVNPVSVPSGIEAEVIQTKHTQKGHDVFVVKLNDRVEKDVYTSLNAAAKKLGGYYSSYRGSGAVPGFQFKTKEAADSFVAATKGESVAAPLVNKEETRAEKLRSAAERLIASGEASLAQDRKQNTARRARMAAGAEADAAAEIAMGKTLMAIADKIESGDGGILSGISAKTEIETLHGIMRQAMSTSDRAIPYSEVEKNKGRKFNQEDAKNIEYPLPSFFTEDIPKISGELEKKPGFKLLAQHLSKINRDAIKKGEARVKVSDPKYIDKIKEAAEQYAETMGWWVKDSVADYMRLQRLGITNKPMLRTAIRSYAELLAEKPKADPVKEAERKLAGKKWEGYFPTPGWLADKLAEHLDVDSSHTILEPSAGKGSLVEAAISAGADVSKIDTLEIVTDLQDILKLKGFNVVGRNFLDHEGAYDRVIMNPPFEEGKDIEHVRHAYKLLKPGGRVVAIMSEGPFFRSDKKAREFRDWLDSSGGTSEKLPEGSFKDSDRSTGVNTRIVIVDKPGDANGASVAKDDGKYSLKGRSPAYGFYSALLSGIESAKQPKADAAQWKGIIKNLPGVKQEELDWSGVNEWLDAQSGAVTKDALLDYLKAEGGVEIQEVIKGDPNSARGRIEKDGKYYVVYDVNDKAVAFHDDFNQAEKQLRSFGNPAADTKFSQYQLPGGENYRELLLTLPSKSGLEPLKGFNSPAEAARRAAASARDFKSSHFDEPNILAHIRFNERTDADGKRVMFIEEVQSDFAQAHRKNKNKLKEALDSDFESIVKAMEKDGLIEVLC